ncbi:MAG TPA: hypothetical protein VHV82_06475 [Sporichthyaceae bacterium]|jgi:hypothetical protein|nr:hypothetical protein [Sporichthyaceae bacterium]
MPLRAPRRTAALIAASAVISAGVFAAAPVAGAADAPVPAYRGSALALAVKVDLGGTTILDTVLPGGVKFPVGGTGELMRLPNELSNVATLQVLDESSKITKDNTLQSNALAASLSVLQGLVGAQLLNADCSADGSQVAGDSQVRGLTLAGTKIPVELGKPNFAAEIPAELAKLVQGGIYVNEQSHSDDGVLQIRALHLRLSVAPDALTSALRSTVPQVRALAERVTGAVETVTGKTLEQLLGKQQAITGGGHGASADADVRRQASALKARPAQDAHATGAAAVARPAVPAATATRSETAAAAAGSSAAAPAQRSTTANTSTAERKADDAAVARQAQDTDTAETTDEQALDQRAERGAQAADPAPQPATPADSTASAAAVQQSPDQVPASPQQADEAAAAPASQPVVTEQSPGARYGSGPATAPAKPDSADVSRGDQTALSRQAAQAAAARADDKSDGSELSVRQRAAAPTAAVPAATAGKGLVNLDIVVSQVSCAGARIVEAAAPVKPAVLPHTGANGHATRDLGVVGLGLILAGSTVIDRLRRRRGPVAH